MKYGKMDTGSGFNLFASRYKMSPHNIKNPLIVTVRLDHSSQKSFQDLRDRYFPPERNMVPAHVSMFHALPPTESEQISADLREISQVGEFRMQIASLIGIGSGVMYGIESEILMEMHQALSYKWKHWLIPQDKQPYKPHIVVQNKADKDVARKTYELLNRTFATSEVVAESFVLWRYLNGPWEKLQEFRFTQR